MTSDVVAAVCLIGAAFTCLESKWGYCMMWVLLATWFAGVLPEMPGCAPVPAPATKEAGPLP